MEMIECLREWSRPWHLQADDRHVKGDWCLYTAFSTLNLWTSFRLWRSANFRGYFESPNFTGWFWAPQMRAGLLPPIPQLPNGLPDYIPTDMARERYLENVRSSVARHGL